MTNDVFEEIAILIFVKASSTLFILSTETVLLTDELTLESAVLSI